MRQLRISRRYSAAVAGRIPKLVAYHAVYLTAMSLLAKPGSVLVLPLLAVTLPIRKLRFHLSVDVAK